MSIIRPARFNFENNDGNPGGEGDQGDPPGNQQAPEIQNMDAEQFAAEFARLQQAVTALQQNNNQSWLQLKSADLATIPEFKGETNLLPLFIKICDQLVTTFGVPDNPNHVQNSRLMRGFLAKIKGQAQVQIGNNDYSTWDILKAKLREFYGDRKTDRTLTIELCRMFQNSGEKPIDFYNRITYQLNLTLAYMNNHNRMDHLEFIHELGLQVFLRGLKDPLRQYLKSRDPKTLVEALNLMTNEFQFETSGSISSETFPGNSSNNQKKQNNKPFQKDNNYQKNNFPSISQNYQSNRPNYQNKPNFRKFGQGKSNFNRDQNQG
ncbi:unnamed protein product [Bemisia tabaci]|uniref:Uncharacterized protein n=1 Tax=Bemisia tabaci TaxID=7038 RepID=A0A9P0ABZ3_BEMTA|nr:unnamed protein product [Bemisia tabaci]